MDDTIDEKDVAYVEGVIKGTNEATNLSDADYNGKVDVRDIDQIELIIRGEEKELTIVDGNGKAVTVRMPVERVIVEYQDNAELMRILNATDKIVGIDFCIEKTKIQFPEISNLPCVGTLSMPDYETTLELDPDLYLVFGTDTDELQKNLPGVAVVFLGLYYPDLSNPVGSRFMDGVRKLGYILDAKDEAEEYINWNIEWIDKIKSRTEELSEDDKPQVFIWSKPTVPFDPKTFRTCSEIDTLTQMCHLAGGKSIAEELPDFFQGTYSITVNPEWVIEQNPDIIIVHAVRYTRGGDTLRPSHGYDEDDPTSMKEDLRDEIMNCPLLTNVTAVKTGNVYIMSGNFRNDATGGITGAAYMARLFHPDHFKDLDPEAIHQEYLTRFQGLDYDLDEHGVFVYPPIEINGSISGIPDRYKGQT